MQGREKQEQESTELKGPGEVRELGAEGKHRVSFGLMLRAILPLSFARGTVPQKRVRSSLADRHPGPSRGGTAGRWRWRRARRPLTFCDGASKPPSLGLLRLGQGVDRPGRNASTAALEPLLLPVLRNLSPEGSSGIDS